MSKTRDRRSNCWSFIIYPGDSAPDNYLQVVQNWHIPALLSPLHTPDPDGEEGEKRKDHIHVMMYFGKGANKSQEQVDQYSQELNGTKAFIVESPDGMIRYFIHKDNPEKQQFEVFDLVRFAGFQVSQAFNNFDQESQMYDNIEDFITDKGIYNFFVLQQSLKQEGRISELEFLRRRSTNYFRSVLDGRYQLVKNNSQMVKIDEDVD